MESKKWLTIAAITVIAVMVVLNQPFNNVEQEKAHMQTSLSNSKLKDKQDATSNNPLTDNSQNTEENKPSATTKNANRTDQDTVEGASKREALKITAWDTLNEVPEQYSELESDGAERHYVEYPNLESEDYRIGDLIDLDIPQLAEQFSTEVVSVKKLTHGGKDITSSYEGADGQTYMVTITIGQNALFATIDTADGTYFVQGHNNEAWIISSEEQSSLITWDEPDHLLPPDAIVPKPTID